MTAKYNHQVLQCERCRKKTRIPLLKVKAGRAVILRVCGTCYQQILGGGPLRKPPTDA